MTAVSPFLLSIIAFVAIVSSVTFLIFTIDKFQAIRRGRRIPEWFLHLLELLGGWPGSLAAQVLVHHKSRKRSYRLALILIIITHLLMIFCLLSLVT